VVVLFVLSIRRTKLASFELDKGKMETGAGAVKMGLLNPLLRIKNPMELWSFVLGSRRRSEVLAAVSARDCEW